MLTVRLRSGVPKTLLGPAERAAAEQTVADGLMVARGDHLVLTDRGRLLADAVVRTIAAA